MSDAPVVLVADDDPDILALMRFRLEREGYEVLAQPTVSRRSTSRSSGRRTSPSST